MFRNCIRGIFTTRKKFSFAVGKDHTSRGISVFPTSEPNGGSEALQKALSDAEKIVGFPTSFLSLRALLSDEFGGLAIYLKKLISTKHPLLNTARGIVFDSKTYMQTRGLVMLLISKAGDVNNQGVPPETYEKLRSLAEITELIHIAFLIHRGVADSEQLAANISKTDADFGNKLAVLGGDFMLANACTTLAKLQNTKIVDLIASSIADMSTSLIVLPESGSVLNSDTFLSIPTTKTQWAEAIRLANGSLLANSCSAALLLTSTEQRLIDAAKQFAYHLVLAQQARHDIIRFTSLEALDQKPNFCSLCCLPVVLMTEERGGRDWLDTFTRRDGDEKIEILNSELYNIVSTTKDSLKSAQSIVESHINAALTNLLMFPATKARNALENVVCSIKK